MHFNVSLQLKRLSYRSGNSMKSNHAPLELYTFLLDFEIPSQNERTQPIFFSASRPPAPRNINAYIFLSSHKLVTGTCNSMFGIRLILKVLIRCVQVGSEKLPYKGIKDWKQEAALTKLRKLQRACSLGDFFEAREVTHDIFLSQIKMWLGPPV